MTGKVTPGTAESAAAGGRELLRLARNIERYRAQKRKLLERVRELEGRILEARRLFRQLTETLVPAESASSSDDELEGAR